MDHGNVSHHAVPNCTQPFRPFGRPNSGEVGMKTLLGALAVLFALSCTAAVGQTPRHQPPRQLKAERFAKKSECLKQARMKRFERNFAARNRFLT